VESVLAEVGKIIKKGEPLVFLDRKTQQFAYEVAKIRAEDESMLKIAQGEVASTTAILNEMKSSSKRRLVSEFQVARAQGELDEAMGRLGLAHMGRKLAELEMKRTKAALDARTLRSPMDGIVVAIHKAEGAVAAGTAVVSVADPEKLSMTMTIPSQVAARLHNGQELPVVLAGGVRRIAEVLKISPDPKSTDGSQTVEMLVSNPNPTVLPNKEGSQVLIPPERLVPAPTAGNAAPQNTTPSS
jgi:multidrug efflux pump subunit AcrA (membrane-fusion protein)